MALDSIRPKQVSLEHDGNVRKPWNQKFKDIVDEYGENSANHAATQAQLKSAQAGNYSDTLHTKRILKTYLGILCFYAIILSMAKSTLIKNDQITTQTENLKGTK